MPLRVGQYSFWRDLLEAALLVRCYRAPTVLIIHIYFILVMNHMRKEGSKDLHLDCFTSSQWKGILGFLCPM